MRVSLRVARIATTTLALFGCGSDDSASAPVADASTPLEEAGALSGLEVVSPLCGGADACSACMSASCADRYAACFGSAWETSLAGICSSFGSCITACDCGDPDCFNSCSDALANPCLGCVESRPPDVPLLTG
jgi:hypothetical protein